MIFCVENETDFDPMSLAGIADLPAFLSDLGDAVLRLEGALGVCEVEASLYVVGDEAIRELNLAHRGIDSATDVLSFPNIDFAGLSVGEALGMAANSVESTDPESGNVLIGDIVVNADRVREQAASYGHSVLREFAFLVTHSLFHLVGYDHETDDEARLMEGKQEAVLGLLGITRGSE